MPPFSPGFRHALLGLAAVAALPAPTAWGQSADIARLTCAAYRDLPAGQRERLTLWLHGYYAGAAQRTQIDSSEVERVAETVQGACERDGALLLIGPEARTMFLGGPAPSPPQAPPEAAPSGSPAAQPAQPQRPTPVR